MSWIVVWTVTALLLIIAVARSAHRFGWRNVITASVLAALMILVIIGTWIDLYLPEWTCQPARAGTRSEEA